MERLADAGVASPRGRSTRLRSGRCCGWSSPTFCAAVIQMPCQIVKSGRRLIYRLLSWNPWQGVFLRLVERLQGCWLC